MVGHARELTSPSFAGWLQVAAFTGMRPGELDALRWSSVDVGASRIEVLEQYSAKTREFTLPKNGRARRAPLTAPAREALMALPREGEFCFVNFRGVCGRLRIAPKDLNTGTTLRHRHHPPRRDAQHEHREHPDSPWSQRPSSG
jgi:integrase